MERHAILQAILNEASAGASFVGLNTSSERTYLPTMNLRYALPALLLPFSAAAQCPFTPTIEPDAPILCPGESVELNTQEYDAYQWYADGFPIDGATAQTLTMQPYAEVTVEATLDGCTEMSAPVIVDGWVFLLPFAMHAGDEPLFIDFDGVSNQCDGDSVLLIFSYDQNVQWTNNGVEIPGANDDTLLVVATGNYSATGAPETCPNYISSLGLEIPFLFHPVVQPTISMAGDQLCATPAGEAYQWYLNGSPLAGNTACIDLLSAGTYTVDVTYAIDCSTTSAPYLSTRIEEVASTQRPLAHPVPANDVVTITWPSTSGHDAWELIDAVGRRVLSGNKGRQLTETIDLSQIPEGHYWLRSGGTIPVVLQVVK